MSVAGIRGRSWAAVIPSPVKREEDTVLKRPGPSTLEAGATGAKRLRFERAERSSSCREQVQVGLCPDWADPPARGRRAGSTPGARSRAGTCSPTLVLGDKRAGRRGAEA